MKRFILLLSFVLVPMLSSAQMYAMRDSVSNGYDFWLYVPSNYEDNRVKRLESNDPSSVKDPLPIVVFLHGRSLSGKDIYKVRQYGTLDALSRGRKINAVVIAPQVNYGDWWRPERVLNVVDWVSKRYDVDPTRLYVLGMSLGGYGTLDFAATYPDRTAAAVALCGGSTKKAATLQNLNKVPLWIMHGTADASVAVSESRKVRDAMSQGDASLPRLRYDEHVGANHSVYARVFYIDEIYTWLFKHTTADKNRPVDRSVSIPHSRYSESRVAYSGLTRGGAVSVIDPPTAANTKGRYLDVDAPAPQPKESAAQSAAPAADSKSKSEKKSDNKSKSTTTKTASSSAKYHTVVEGDTLGHIAVKYNTSVKALCELNNMDKNDILKLGMQLQVSEAPAEPVVVYHIIEAGDTYSGIALKYGTTVKKILELNGATETTIYHPGDQIIVSSTTPESAPKKNSTKTSKSSASKEVYHTIVDGDTLGHIAVKYDTTVKRICELNNMEKDEILKLGRKLRVK